MIYTILYESQVYNIVILHFYTLWYNHYDMSSNICHCTELLRYCWLFPVTFVLWLEVCTSHSPSPFSSIPPPLLATTNLFPGSVFLKQKHSGFLSSWSHGVSCFSHSAMGECRVYDKSLTLLPAFQSIVISDRMMDITHSEFLLNWSRRRKCKIFLKFQFVLHVSL